MSLIHGVAEILNEKIWSLTPLKLVGCITLKIYEGYNASLIVEQAREQLSPFFDTLYIEIASCQSTKT